MKRVHDLGGKEGFGPIETNEAEVAFQHEWEGREWGIARSAGAPGLTIDWWRHIRELILEEDYLNRPYYDSWAQTDLAAFIDAGVITMEEAISGVSNAQYSTDAEPLRSNIVHSIRRKSPLPW